MVELSTPSINSMFIALKIQEIRSTSAPIKLKPFISNRMELSNGQLFAPFVALKTFYTFKTGSLTQKKPFIR